jgi:hypothetical protein
VPNRLIFNPSPEAIELDDLTFDPETITAVELTAEQAVALMEMGCAVGGAGIVGTLSTSQGNNKDVTLTGIKPGVAFRLKYVTGAVLRAHVTGSTSATADITVTLVPGVTTAAHVVAAIQADPQARSLAIAAIKSGQNGTGKPAAADWLTSTGQTKGLRPTRNVLTRMILGNTMPEPSITESKVILNPGPTFMLDGYGAVGNHAISGDFDSDQLGSALDHGCLCFSTGQLASGQDEQGGFDDNSNLLFYTRTLDPTPIQVLIADDTTGGDSYISPVAVWTTEQEADDLITITVHFDRRSSDGVPAQLRAALRMISSPRVAVELDTHDRPDLVEWYLENGNLRDDPDNPIPLEGFIPSVLTHKSKLASMVRRSSLPA